MSQYTASIQALYVAYFNRPADPSGLAFWEPIVAAANGNTAAVSADFAKQPEYKAAYAGMSSDQIINQVYLNLFGRTVDSQGLNFWSPKLSARLVSIDQIVTEVVKGAQGNSDGTTYNNRVIASVAYTDALNADVNLRLAYSNAAAITSAKSFLNGITTTDSLTAAIAAPALAANLAQMVIDSTPAPVVTTHTLTTGIDAGAAFIGAAGNDTFNALVGTNPAAGANANDTLTPLDNLDGGAGANVLNISDLGQTGWTFTGATVKNIQTVNITSAGAVTANLKAATGVTGVTQLNTSGLVGGDVITVGSGTAVSAKSVGAVTVHGTDSAVTVNAKGLVTIDTGASTETVNTAGGVALSGATGAVTVTDTAQGAVQTVIKDGTSVSLTSAVALDSTVNTVGNVATKSTIAVGATSHLPTGVVTIVENVTGDKAGNAFAGSIAVLGGTTVSVTETATQALVAAPAAGATATNFTATQSAVNVTGSAATTSVTVNQAAAVAAHVSTTAAAGANVTDSVVFSGMTVGQTVTVGGLTFTATGTVSATQAAAAFANLTAGAIQGASTLGTYSGTFSGFSSGANSTATVIFTSSTATTGGADVGVAFTGGTLPALTQTVAGLTAVAAAAGVGGIANGVDTIADLNYGGATANTITSVTLNGFATGSAVSSDALTSLSLANAGGVGVTVNNHTAATLGLTLNGITGVSTLNIDGGTAGTYKALNVTATTASSALDITASGVSALNVSGTSAVDLTSATVGHLGNASAALKTVVVSGSAGVTGNFSGALVTDVNASATSGAVTVTIDASKATYEGGSGADKVTLSGAGSKAVSLGAGNDSLTLASGTTTLSAMMDGGTGINTLVMAAADAATASLTNSFQTNFTNFQQLSLGATAAAASNTVNLANMNGISYVISAGGANGTESAVVTWNATAAATGSESIGGMTITTDGVATHTAADFATVAAGGTVAGLSITATPTLWAVTAPVGGTDVFTSVTAGTNVTDITGAAFTGSGAAPSAVITQGGATGSLTLTHMANGGTLQLNGAGAGAIVTMTDATGTSDSFNIVLSKAGAMSAGTVAVAGVESINISATDTTSKVVANTNTQTLTLTDSAATSITVTGNAHLTLTNNGAAVSTIDASAMTGGITVTAAGTVAETIKGGASSNTLTASGGITGTIADRLIGGAGADILTANAGLDILTGGAGADTFVIVASSNSNSYATITDASAGDMIKFGVATAATSFAAAQVTLAATAVFQDFANAAVHNTGTVGAISWFQYGGDTYVVENRTGAESSFNNGTDMIVKLTGTVDLSHTSLNATFGVLLIG